MQIWVVFFDVEKVVHWQACSRCRGRHSENERLGLFETWRKRVGLVFFCLAYFFVYVERFVVFAWCAIDSFVVVVVVAIVVVVIIQRE